MLVKNSVLKLNQEVQRVANMKISKINFPIYGIIICISIIIGILYIYLSLKDDIKKDKRINYFFILLYPFVLSFGLMYTNIIEGKMGLSSFGGLIGAILAAIIFEKILPTKNKVLKYTILSMTLIYGISKIACFIVGCCFGIPYEGILSVTYINGLNIPVFPVQALEVILNLILFFILNKIKNNKYIIPITLISASTLKFLTDFLRYSHIEEAISINQVICLLTILIGIVIIIIKRRRTIN